MTLQRSLPAVELALKSVGDALVSRFGIGWRFADRVDKDLIDARNRLLGPLEAATLRGLAVGTVANPITKPLGISEPRH